MGTPPAPRPKKSLVDRDMMQVRDFHPEDFGPVWSVRPPLEIAPTKHWNRPPLQDDDYSLEYRRHEPRKRRRPKQAACADAGILVAPDDICEPSLGTRQHSSQ